MMALHSSGYGFGQDNRIEGASSAVSSITINISNAVFHVRSRTARQMLLATHLMIAIENRRIETGRR